VIAHRLSTIAKLDRIVVLDNGTVTEEGTHKQLLDQNGTYARLWGHQSGGFIED
jgi:ABC-type multidrug transport system fused ATPase/permease subunit